MVYETASACLCGKLRRTHCESLNCSQYKTFKVVTTVIQEVVSPNMMIPEGRLQSLVEQALDRQLERCLFHNVRKPMVSLLSDYQCGREQIPSAVCQVSLVFTL